MAKSQVSVKDVLTDPRFQQMSAEQKRQVLLRLDPGFANLTPQQQNAVIAYRPSTQAAKPASAAPQKQAPKQTTYLEDFENAMRRTAGERSMEDLRAAANAPVVRGPDGRLMSLNEPMRAGERQFAPNVLADLANMFRQSFSGGNAAMAGAMATPWGRAILSPYLMYQGGIEGAKAPVTGLGEGLKQIATGTYGATPEEIQERLTKGAMFYGGAAGVREATRPKLASMVRIPQQQILGAGKEPVFEARRAQAKKVAEIEGRNLAEIEKTRLQNEEAARKAREKYNEELGKYQSGKEKSAAKVAEARKEWMRKTEEAERGKLEKAGRPAEKRGAERRVRDYAEDFQADAKRARAEKIKPLNERWNTFRRLTKEAVVPREQAYGIIRDAQERLKGAPPDLTVFNQAMKEIGVEVDEHGELAVKDPEMSTDMPLDNVRAMSVAIGDKLAKGGLPGSTFQALKFAKEALETKIIEPTAEQHGAGQFYRNLKRDWAEFKTDFDDVKSPLANVIQAKNAAAAEKVMLGDSREQLSTLAAKYQGVGKTGSGQGGLTPTTISAAGRLQQNIADLPAIRGAKGSQQGLLLGSESPALQFARRETEPPPKTPGEPKLELPTPKQPNLETAPAEKTPAEIRLDIIRHRAGEPYRFWDFMPPKVFERMLIHNERFRRWVAAQPRNELPIPKFSYGPEPDIDLLMRGGGGGGAGAAQQHAIWQGVVDNLRAKLARERAAGEGSQFYTLSKLREAEDRLRASFGTGYMNMSMQGGGGANYTAADLEAFKKKYGIQ